jgi:hypothetical protein
MKLTAYSRNRLLETFNHWGVPKDFADPMYNYLVFGFSPGSCFSAVLANDFARAIVSSHPANTVEAFKSLSGWVQDTVPQEARGDWGRVLRWAVMSDEERRSILEEHGLIYTEQDEVIMALQSKHTVEPILY